MLTVRQIKTKVVAMTDTVPEHVAADLDENGEEVELLSVVVPIATEADSPAAIDAYVADRAAEESNAPTEESHHG